MTCRIQLLAASGNAAVVRVDGRIQADHVGAIKDLIDGGNCVTALDLTEVTLVDRDVVPFLVGCELKGIELLNCPRFLREWVAKERAKI